MLIRGSGDGERQLMRETGETYRLLPSWEQMRTAIGQCTHRPPPPLPWERGRWGEVRVWREKGLAYENEL